MPLSTKWTATGQALWYSTMIAFCTLAGTAGRTHVKDAHTKHHAIPSKSFFLFFFFSPYHARRQRKHTPEKATPPPPGPCGVIIVAEFGTALNLNHAVPELQ